METLISLLPIIIMFIAMWFILIRPAQKRQKQTLEMQNALQRGDRVVTVGGLHATIEAVDDTTVILNIADGVNVRFEKGAIGRVDK
ncbi:MAG: preprotein translocase subunit YajC [Caryophanon sp.]|uniref:Preprotein translocase subunit YajC n=1 Tax=Caryophanon latum TaxID=33977 RepID=A0A1C0Z5I8_9BACL|nr:preprotein translocase subunit YajC [Caryophanon latum]MEE1133080.1 preprotein translocase subunit YajC [Caryophanon sp.]OCS94666.1 preprotein translocase subunit YajC [Caryophanon latum]